MLLLMNTGILTFHNRESTRSMGMTTRSVRVADLSAVVLARLYTFGAEDIIQTRASVLPGVNPRFNRLEHGAMGIVAHVPNSWVVEHTQTVVDDLPLRDVGMFPGIQDTRSDVLHDRGCDVTGRLVEDIGEVVLGEERVRRVSASRIGPGFILVLARCIDDACGAGLERVGSGADERANERSQQ